MPTKDVKLKSGQLWKGRLGHLEFTVEIVKIDGNCVYYEFKDVACADSDTVAVFRAVFPVLVKDI